MYRLIPINDVTQLTVGQLYLYSKYEGELRYGYCTQIQENGRVSFKNAKHYITNDVVNIGNLYRHEQVYVYDAGAIRAYDRMKKKHAQEVKDFFDGKQVEITYRKWEQNATKKRNWFGKWLGSLQQKNRS